MSGNETRGLCVLQSRSLTKNVTTYVEMNLNKFKKKLDKFEKFNMFFNFLIL